MDALTKVLSTLHGLRADVDMAINEVEDIIASTRAAAAEQEQIASVRQLRFGAKVDAGFKAGVLWIEEQLGLDADKLMACIHFETGGTFDSKTKNLAGSSGLGLIQFMRATHANMLKAYPNLRNVAPTHASLADLTPLQQLTFVYYYFKDFGGGKGLSHWSLEDVYMAILYPKAIGKDLEWVMPWKYGSLAYKQNSGLDLNKDQKITKAEASAGVRRSWALGAQFMG